jgi:hypothetical protein
VHENVFSPFGTRSSHTLPSGSVHLQADLLWFFTERHGSVISASVLFVFGVRAEQLATRGKTPVMSRLLT